MTQHRVWLSNQSSIPATKCVTSLSLKNLPPFRCRIIIRGAEPCLSITLINSCWPQKTAHCHRSKWKFKTDLFIIQLLKTSKKKTLDPLQRAGYLITREANKSESLGGVGRQLLTVHQRVPILAARVICRKEPAPPVALDPVAEVTAPALLLSAVAASHPRCIRSSRPKTQKNHKLCIDFESRGFEESR